MQSLFMVPFLILFGVAPLGGVHVPEPEPFEFEVVPETGIDYRPLAQCLTDKGWVMYGADWCPHCRDQKADFGAAFELITYVECVENPDLCQEMGIEGYPTWIHDGEKLSGRRTVWELSDVSGCGF